MDTIAFNESCVNDAINTTDKTVAAEVDLYIILINIWRKTKPRSRKPINPVLKSRKDPC